MEITTGNYRDFVYPVYIFSLVASENKTSRDDWEQYQTISYYIIIRTRYPKTRILKYLNTNMLTGKDTWKPQKPTRKGYMAFRCSDFFWKIGYQLIFTILSQLTRDWWLW